MRKKIIVMLTAIVMLTSVFLFAGCGRQDNSVDESEIKEFIANFDRRTPFTDDEVLVILTEEASFKRIFQDYTEKDFSGIGAIQVKPLNGSSTNRIRQCLSEDSSGKTVPENLKSFKRMFCITLDKKDEDNVLRAVYLLRQYPDIDYAEPNWLMSLDD